MHHALAFLHIEGCRMFAFFRRRLTANIISKAAKRRDYYSNITSDSWKSVV
jgi:hypothetical protein